MQHELIKRLEQIQAAEGVSDRGFAQKLGITNGQWSAVRRGDSVMGRKTLGAVVRIYPGLGTLAEDYWLGIFRHSIVDVA